VKGSGVITVRYQLVEKDKRYILTRSEQDCFSETPPAFVFPQMERISGFLVECYDGSKWVKSWNTALGQPRPKMVRITVQYEEDGKPIDFSVLSTPQVIGS
jgi:general secretion pathway protein J